MAHRLALATCGATLVLILAGGLVTNTGAALAVPDWPTTFGQNLFLFPWSGMVGGVFYEHSHRLLGAAVGLLTLGLAALLWVSERRGFVRGLGVVAAGLICLQGLLGGLRVLLLRDTLAIVHGSVAQAFFALTVALAVFTSPRWVPEAAPGGAGDPRAEVWLGGAAAATLYLQVVFGALTTHAGWVGLHIGWAAVVVLAVGVAVVRVLARFDEAPALARPARALGLLLVLQLALGFGAYLARFTGLAVPGGAVAVLALPVAHRVTGALTLGTAVMLTLALWRGPVGSRADAHAVMTGGVSGVAA